MIFFNIAKIYNLYYYKHIYQYFKKVMLHHTFSVYKSHPLFYLIHKYNYINFIKIDCYIVNEFLEERINLDIHRLEEFRK
jgi:hypothetical protein